MSRAPHPRRIFLRPRRRLLIGLLIASQLLGVACAANPTTKTFDGEWTYNGDCNLGHYVNVTLVQKGTAVTGQWGDGTNSEGWDGALKGHVREGKLHVRYCSSEPSSAWATCPAYDATETDYFVRQGPDLAWYRGSGKGNDRSFSRYVVLHPVIKGKAAPDDKESTGDDASCS